jgi:hypothetical protein
MLGRLINNEMEMIRKEVIVTPSRYPGGICVEGLKKAMKSPSLDSGIPAGTRNEQHLNKYLDCDRYINLLGNVYIILL